MGDYALEAALLEMGLAGLIEQGEDVPVAAAKQLHPADVLFHDCPGGEMDAVDPLQSVIPAYGADDRAWSKGAGRFYF